jgi:RNase P subunit RPR2
MTDEINETEADLRKCRDCGKEKPLTKKYWYRLKDGIWRVNCKECFNSYRYGSRAPKRSFEENPSVELKCGACGVMKPRTFEYFMRYKGRVQITCLECKRSRNNKTNQALWGTTRPSNRTPALRNISGCHRPVVELAHNAIGLLRQMDVNDPRRTEALEFVAKWIKQNREVRP